MSTQILSNPNSDNRVFVETTVDEGIELAIKVDEYNESVFKIVLGYNGEVLKVLIKYGEDEPVEHTLTRNWDRIVKGTIKDDTSEPNGSA